MIAGGDINQPQEVRVSRKHWDQYWNAIEPNLRRAKLDHLKQLMVKPTSPNFWGGETNESLQELVELNSASPDERLLSSVARPEIPSERKCGLEHLEEFKAGVLSSHNKLR